MEFAKLTTHHLCAIDLHGQSQFICIMNNTGKILHHKELPANEIDLITYIGGYLPDISICVESTFNWYWVADMCHDLKIPFHLAHALYLKHIHGGKSKNDRIDSKKLANLLRCGYLPVAYPYPKEMRAVRDLFRARSYYMKMRNGCTTQFKQILYQEGKSELVETAFQRKNSANALVGELSHHATQVQASTKLTLVKELDNIIKNIEKECIAQIRLYDNESLRLLYSIPGCGPILGATILCEMHTPGRFKNAGHFSSYARVVKCTHSSSDKIVGPGHNKIGNPTLRWAFGELAITSIRHSPRIKKYYQTLKAQYGSARSLARLSHKFAVAVYYMLKNKISFNIDKFAIAAGG